MRYHVLAAALLALGAGTLQAQQTDTGGARPRLEQRVRERMAAVLRNRVGLNDQQIQQLAEVNRRIEPQRMQMLQNEREVRSALREEILTQAAPNQTRIDNYLKRMLELQHQRLDLVENEQRELSRFMTPLQRAKYLAVQEQFRARIAEMRRNRAGAGARPGAGPARRPGLRPLGERRPLDGPPPLE